MLAYQHGIDRAMIRGLVGWDTPQEEIDSALLERIEPRPNGMGSDRTIVRAGGVSVWAIIVALDAAGSIEQVMADYDLYREDVLAAILSNLRNPEPIEARIALINRSFAE